MTATTDVQAALRALDPSPHAWAATGDEQCGGWVITDPQPRPCTEPGTWAVRGYTRAFCPAHAAHRLRLAHGRANHSQETTR